MNISAATVTVYFFGLVHFYNVQAGGSSRAGSGDVYVPLATSTSRTFQATTLAKHEASIIVRGVDKTTKTCADFGGSNGPTASDCTFSNLSAKEVVLPTTTSTPGLSLGSGFSTVPSLKNVCQSGKVIDVGPIRTDVETAREYAIHVSLSRGKLNACTPKKPPVSYLTIDNAATSLSIGGTSIPLLPSDTTIEIRSEPVVHDTAAAVQKSHFWWHFTLYTNVDSCDGLPSPTPVECPDGFPSDHTYATEVGCSNTQYP